MIRFIRDIFANASAVRRPVVSFEFFPTKTDEGERTLLEKTIPALRELNPDFCSVTYGAGGGTRDKTLGIVDRIQREHEITAMAHLTCVNATIDETRTVLEQTRALGITNILALRGDPPNGGEFVRTEGGFEYSLSAGSMHSRGRRRSPSASPDSRRDTSPARKASRWTGSG